MLESAIDKDTQTFIFRARTAKSGRNYIRPLKYSRPLRLWITLVKKNRKHLKRSHIVVRGAVSIQMTMRFVKFTLWVMVFQKESFHVMLKWYVCMHFSEIKILSHMTLSWVGR